MYQSRTAAVPRSLGSVCELRLSLAASVLALGVRRGLASDWLLDSPRERRESCSQRLGAHVNEVGQEVQRSGAVWWARGHAVQYGIVFRRLTVVSSQKQHISNRYSPSRRDGQK